MFKRLAVVVLGLAVVLTFWAPTAWADYYSGGVTTSLGLFGPGGNAAKVVPPSDAITSQQAIAAVAKYFTPPAGAAVNAEYSSSFSPCRRKAWIINWMVITSLGSGESGQNMMAVVDAMTGRILALNRFPVGGVSESTTKAVYSYRQAQDLARRTMAELAPEAVGRVELVSSPGSFSPYFPFALYSHDYSFYFVRLQNGLPVLGYSQPQGVQIGVNPGTGRVDNYSYNWLTGLSFPSPQPAVGVAQAAYAWWNSGGLELRYVTPPSPPVLTAGPDKARLAYVQHDGGLYVEAATGRVVDVTGQPASTASWSRTIPAPAVPPASPPAGGLTSSTAAISWAGKVLPLPAGYKIASVGQGQTGPAGQNRQTWNLSWSAGQESAVVVSASFFVDNGRLQSYFAYPAASGPSGQAALSRQEALQKAVDFLADTAGIDVSAGYRLEPALATENQDRYTFLLSPMPNGIPLDTDMGGVSVSVNAATGQVLDFYNYARVPGDLPSRQGNLSLDRIRDIFTKDVSLQLSYLIPGGPNLASAPRLVYSVPVRFAGAVIDAQTGALQDRQGNDLFLGSGPPADVAGSWAADSIEAVLQKNFLSVDARGLFHPRQPVSRGEAVEMLLKAVNGYPLVSSPGPADFADVPAGSTWYGAVQQAFELGWLAKADRFHPNDPVTRQDFAVLVIRALKYGAVGRMAPRIALPYRDAGLVNPAEANYVALAAGLGIFSSGGDFRPLDPLTRAEAATVLVRLPSPR